MSLRAETDRSTLGGQETNPSLANWRRISDLTSDDEVSAIFGLDDSSAARGLNGSQQVSRETPCSLSDAESAEQCVKHGPRIACSGY